MFFFKGTCELLFKTFLNYFLIFLLDVLGLYCGMCALFGCGVWPSRGSDSSCGGEQAPGTWALVATARRKAVMACGL